MFDLFFAFELCYFLEVFNSFIRCQSFSYILGHISDKTTGWIIRHFLFLLSFGLGHFELLFLFIKYFDMFSDFCLTICEYLQYAVINFFFD